MYPRLRLISPVLGAVLLVACGGDPGDRGPDAKPTAAIPGQLTLSKLEMGAAPNVAFSHEGFFNGDTTKEVLPANVDQFAETKQLLVVRDIDGNVYAYSPDGPIGTTPIGQATGDLAINAERNLVAWIAPDGSPTVLQEGEARPAVLEKQAGVESGDAVAVVGHDCFNGPETVEGSGCSVYFRSAGGDQPESFVSSNHGFVQPLREAGELLNLQDVDDDGEIGWTKLNDDLSTCSAYTPRVDADSGETTGWLTCDHMPVLFSPDGKHILATGPHGYEGLGASELTILDRPTGKPALTLRNTKSQAAIIDMVWEDDSHVLAVVTQGEDWAIVRVGLDGSVELAAKPLRLKTEGDPIPFLLAVRP